MSVPTADAKSMRALTEKLSKAKKLLSAVYIALTLTRNQRSWLNK